MRFRITGLSPQPFQHLFGLPDAELAGHGAKRCIADEKPGFPCRIEMPDAGLGKTVLLLNHTYQPATRRIMGHMPYSSEKAPCGLACSHCAPSMRTV